MMTTTRKAVALLSGGLDSLLAARLVIDQGVQVEGLHYGSPWGAEPEVFRAGEELGIPVTVRPRGQDYIDLIRAPKYGYGKNMNPCIDCRIHMYRMAKGFMGEVGAEFLVTGEVIGQRPMSQRRNALALIDRESGLEGRIVRPLCARHLKPTLAEREGWVDRSRFEAFGGRGRNPQFDLANRLGLKAFKPPAGGCPLTDPEFSIRVRDLFAHAAAPRLEDAKLLKYGRHFRIDGQSKVIVSRRRQENDPLVALAPEDAWILDPRDFLGPVALASGPKAEPLLEWAAAAVLAYSPKAPDGEREFRVWRGDEPSRVFRAARRLTRGEVERYKV